MLNQSIDNLLDMVYRKTGSYDPREIAKSYHFNILYSEIGPTTLGTRITNSRCTTIILDDNLSDAMQRIVPLHEIKHCLTDQGIGTPFLRKNSSNTPIAKREYEANSFAMKAFVRSQHDEFEDMNKYQICESLGLDDYWAQFI